MTTIFEEKAQQLYSELAEMERNREVLGKKTSVEAEAKAEREVEAKARQSVSRALVNCEDAASALGRFVS